MGDDNLTAHGDAGAGTITTYLDAVASRLIGPYRWRAEVLTELRDGLCEAAEHHGAAGIPRAEATRLAVAEFGDPVAVASGFAGEAAARQAHRVAGRLLVSGPLVAASWLVAMGVTGVPLMGGQLSGPWLAMPLVGLVVAVAVPAAVLAVTAAGRGANHFADRPALAPAAAGAAAGLCAVGDLVMLAMFALWLVVSGGPPVAAVIWLAVAGAVAVSVTRLLLASVAARRCVVTRARLAERGTAPTPG